MNLRVIGANLVVSIKSFYREKTGRVFQDRLPGDPDTRVRHHFHGKDNEIFDLDVQDLDRTKSASAELVKAIGSAGDSRFPRSPLPSTPHSMPRTTSEPCPHYSQRL
jgi:hypothetical protein